MPAGRVALSPRSQTALRFQAWAREWQALMPQLPQITEEKLRELTELAAEVYYPEGSRYTTGDLRGLVNELIEVEGGDIQAAIDQLRAAPRSKKLVKAKRGPSKKKQRLKRDLKATKKIAKKVAREMR